MSGENSLIDAALRGWKSNVERADKLFGALSPEQLEQQVAPGKNRLIYLWGHLAAVNDGLLPLLGIGERLHPELDAMFSERRQIRRTDGYGKIPQGGMGRDQPKARGKAIRSSRLRTGRGGIPRYRRRISSGSRIGIDSRFCSEEPRTLPITWGRRPLARCKGIVGGSIDRTASSKRGRTSPPRNIRSVLQGIRNDSEGIFRNQIWLSS